MEQELKMSVSPVCQRDGEKYAFVSFADDNRLAEGKIPECRIISNKGFNKEEVEQLEDYMRRELTGLKRMAAGIRLFDVITK